MGIKEKLAAMRAAKQTGTKTTEAAAPKKGRGRPAGTAKPVDKKPTTKAPKAAGAVHKGAPKGPRTKMAVGADFVTEIEKSFGTFDSNYNEFKMNLEKFLDGANKSAAKSARANMMVMRKLGKSIGDLIQAAKTEGLVEAV